MTALRWYINTSGTTVLEITDRVRIPVDQEGIAIALGQKAEAGSGWEGELYVDDQSANLVPLPFRRIYCNNDDGPAGDQVVGNWFVTHIKVGRMDPWDAPARTYTLSIADENSLLRRFIFDGTDCIRPEETDIARLDWFFGTTEGSTFSNDMTYIDRTNPKLMDAVNLQQMTPEDMFAAMYAASGKGYWVMYREDLTPHQYGIWYANQDTSQLYSSTASLSNVDAEIDNSTVFALSPDAVLDRAPDRMAYQLFAPYKKGYVKAANADFLTVYGHVDRTAPAPQVKTQAKAQAQVERQLKELQIPDDEIQDTWTVAGENLHLIRQGMRVPIHATHFPNYTDDTDPSITGYQLPGYAAGGVWCRVVERGIRQLTNGMFEVPLRLSPQPVICEVMGLNKATPGLVYDVPITQTPSGFRYYLSHYGSSGDYVSSDPEGLSAYPFGGLLLRPCPGADACGSGQKCGGAFFFSNYGFADATMPTGHADGGTLVDPKVQMSVVGPGSMRVWLTNMPGKTASGTVELWGVDVGNPADPTDGLNPDVHNLISSTALAVPYVDIEVPDDGLCFHYVAVRDSALNHDTVAFGGWTWTATI